MVDWIARLRHRRQQRMINRAAVQVVSEGQGVAARTWPLTPAIKPDKLGEIRVEAQAWLAANIAVAASPYGWSECSVLVALACSDNGQRRLLWKRVLPPFPKAEREQALVQADDQLAALPLAAFPAATQLELYLLDMGAVLRDAFATLDVEALEKKGG